MHDEGAYLTPTSTRNIGKIFTVLNKSKVFLKKKKSPLPSIGKNLRIRARRVWTLKMQGNPSCFSLLEQYDIKFMRFVYFDLLKMSFVLNMYNVMTDECNA